MGAEIRTKEIITFPLRSFWLFRFTNARAWVCLLGLILWSIPGQAQEIRLTESTDAIMKACAIGRTLKVEVKVRGGIIRWLQGAQAKGTGNISDLGGILKKIQPTDVGTRFYEIYVRCLKEQAEIELKRLNIKRSETNKRHERLLRARELVWRFGGTNSTRIRLNDRNKPKLYLFDLSCSLFVWLEEVELGGNNSGMIVLKPTGSALEVVTPDFEFAFSARSLLARDAVYRTIEKNNNKQSRQLREILTGRTRTFDAILVIRTLKPSSCRGKYFIEYPDKKET